MGYTVLSISLSDGVFVRREVNIDSQKIRWYSMEQPGVGFNK